jgi:phage protein D
MTANVTKYAILYNNKNITNDISRFMLSLTYNDKTQGESDDIEIELEDKDGLWQNSWYPEKGAKITMSIGNLKCGVFEIDEIEVKGPPDTVSIRAMATGVTNSLRTTKSDAHENKTLKQIAEKIAQKNGLTVSGDIPEITIGRVTQNQETDLAFLKRISQSYGVVFSVRENTITFTSIYGLEQRGSSLKLDKTEITSYSIKDKANGMVKSASVKSKNPKKNASVSTNLEYQEWLKTEGYKYPDVVNKDASVTHTRVENKQQADAKAKAIMHTSASNQQEGSFDFDGNELAVAGNNFDLSGFGVLSGKWNILNSSHKLDKSGGYTVSVEAKRLQTPSSKAQQKSTTKKVNKNKDAVVSNSKTEKLEFLDLIGLSKLKIKR